MSQAAELLGDVLLVSRIDFSLAPCKRKLQVGQPSHLGDRYCRLRLCHNGHSGVIYRVESDASRPDAAQLGN